MGPWIVAFRKHTLLLLEDCLYASQASLPHLTRSSLHRCLQRHDIARLPDVEGDKPAKKKFKAYPIGYYHIDIAEVQTAEVKLFLFVAIDRTSKFAFVKLVDQATRVTASAFLTALIAAVPYKIHTVLTGQRHPVPLFATLRRRAACAVRLNRTMAGMAAAMAPAGAPASIPMPDRRYGQSVKHNRGRLAARYRNRTRLGCGSTLKGFTSASMASEALAPICSFHQMLAQRNACPLFKP